MKDDLDRVLEGLGRVEAPLGLEGRVLRAMAAPARGRRFVWGWVLAMALILVGLLMGSLGKGKNPETVGFADTPPFAIQPQRMGHPEVVVRKGPGEFRGGSTHRVKQRREEWGAEGLPVTQQVAGFLAPAAPLTDQERLLLQLARRANGGTVAMFDPMIREERAAAEKAEFEFFNPQPAVVTAEPEETDHAVPGKQ